MNRKSIIRRNRKKLMRLGEITEEIVLSRDDDGVKYPKKEWGYSVHCKVNGWTICAPDRNKYEAFKGALEAAEWATERSYDDFVKDHQDLVEEAKKGEQHAV